MAGNKRASYKLVTYSTKDGPRAGIVVGDAVFDAAKVTGKAAYATVAGILADWKTAERALGNAAGGAATLRGKSQPLGKTKLLAPVPNPATIFCAGANYQDHAAAMAKKHGMPEPADPHKAGTQAVAFHQGGADHHRPGGDGESVPLFPAAGLGA